MGFLKEVYSNDRAGLVVVFNRGENSDNYFNGDSVVEAMKYFNIYEKDGNLFIKTEKEIALDTMGVATEDAVALRSALDEMLVNIPDEEVEPVMVLFPLWKEDAAYEIGMRVRYGNNVYKVLQAHTSQADWTPDVAVSLFAALLVVKTPEGEQVEIPDWVQPDSTNPYMTGDKVMFNGLVYESLIDNNSWSPADYPAGWQEIIEE